MPFSPVPGWQQWVLLSSDHHWDSTHCQRDLLRWHLDQAVARSAVVCGFGDTLDLMGAKYDKRSNKAGVRPEHQVPNYFDAVIEDAAEWLAPYAPNIAMLGQGNHETKVTQVHEICATSRLVGLLNAHAGGHVFDGKYSGWVVFKFQGIDGELVLNYHHGPSSGKTSSNIQAHEKRAAWLPDADVIISGHAHNFWSERVGRLRLSEEGTVYQDTQLHLGMPGYKDEIEDGAEGWANEKSFRPKVCGAWWLVFFWDPNAGEVRHFTTEAM